MNICVQDNSKGHVQGGLNLFRVSCLKLRREKFFSRETVEFCLAPMSL